MLDMPTPDERNYPWTAGLLGAVLGGAVYWGLLQFPGAVLQGALRLPGKLVVTGGLVPSLQTVGMALPPLVQSTIAHLLCLLPFAMLGAAVFARERIWAAVIGLVLFMALVMALIYAWRFGG
jgi:hypothetical protein